MARRADKGSGGDRDVAVNRRARFEYEIEEVFEAGIVLVGSEVKSLRDGAVTLSDGYVLVHDGVPQLLNVHIAEYTHANRHNHEPTRPRKLLLHRREAERIDEAVSEKGRSCVPLRIYFKQGLAKVEIAVARGKKHYDKRHDLKERDAKREIDRARSEHQ